jgi:predicted nucleic acid-binding protein
MKVFIDTGAFIAVIDKDDDYHDAAEAFFKKALEKEIKFMTTNFVVCETMNYLRSKISHSMAVFFWEHLKKSNVIEILRITPDIQDTAFKIFKQYVDKDFSFTDCTSFSAMKAFKINRVFAFDKHFEQYGHFERLP